MIKSKKVDKLNHSEAVNETLEGSKSDYNDGSDKAFIEYYEKMRGQKWPHFQ